MGLLEQIEQSGAMVWVRESGSLWGFPAFLFMHTIGLAVVAGLSGALCLRVLGFAPKVPLAALDQCFLFIWAAFGVTTVSGLVLLAADATAKLGSPVFYVKLAFIALALMAMRALRRRVFANPPASTAPLPSGVKGLAIVSLLCWMGATTAGRLMAYLGQVGPGL